jgi:hypothetical protein
MNIPKGFFVFVVNGHQSFTVVIVFPVILAFRSFRLSGHSGFPVIPAFRSFLLFLNRSDQRKQKKKFYKGKHIFVLFLISDTELP